MDIQTLRKARNTDFSSITGAFDKVGQSGEKKSYIDDRFWKIEGDKAGNGSATIRFLAKVESDELPWVRTFSHGFQGPTGKWYIENSLTTLGEDDPVGELNTKLWNSGSEANKEIARKQKRRLSFIANILVISDTKHPENEGKVFLFKFGKKIFDKLMDKANPTFEDEKPVNVFDYWEGANFKLRMRKKDGFTNYDESVFSDIVALGEDDAILSVAKKQVALAEFIDRKNFKSYGELKTKLEQVLSGDSFSSKSAAQMSEEEDRPSAAAPKLVSKPVPAAGATDDEDDSDVMSYFQKIAREE